MDEHEHELSEEQLAELQGYREAFRQEFENARTTVDASRNAALKDLDDLKESALSAIKRAIDNRDNLKLSSDVARWCYDHLIRQGKATADPLTDLLAGADEARSRAKK